MADGPAQPAAGGGRRRRVGVAATGHGDIGAVRQPGGDRRLLCRAAGRVAAAKAQDQFRPDPGAGHHPQPGREQSGRHCAAGEPSGFLDHRGAGGDCARARHSGRSGDGVGRSQFRRGHRSAGFPAAGRSHCGDGGRQRIGAGLYCPASQSDDLSRHDRVPGGVQFRADPGRACDRIAANVAGGGTGAGAVPVAGHRGLRQGAVAVALAGGADQRLALVAAERGGGRQLGGGRGHCPAATARMGRAGGRHLGDFGGLWLRHLALGFWFEGRGVVWEEKVD